MIKLPHVIEGSLSILSDNSLLKIQTNIQMIKAPELWAQNIHGNGRVVAVIDTGCDINHEALSENIIGGYNFTSHDEYDVSDSTGHGTHVAGIIASKGAVLGVAPESKLLILKVFDHFGSTSYERLIQALDYALQWRDPNGKTVDIINLSLGSNQGDEKFRSKIEEVYQQGIIMVGAAGNNGDGLEDTVEVSYPSNYNNVIQVGAVDNKGEVADFSNTNPSIDFLAPGVSVLSTIPGGGFGEKTGTSMAAPHVAGGLALLLNEYTSDELTSFLFSRRDNHLAKAKVVDLQSFYGIRDYYEKVLLARSF